ncbi:MAG: hypothetical protein ACRDLS_03560 [Solirubrobacteraceae bacterium]
MELSRSRQRARVRTERGTVVLGVFAFGMTATVLGAELVRVWRGRAEQLAELHVADPGEVAIRDTMEAAVVGYEHSPARERALLNLLTSFSGTFAAARLSTYLIRRRGGGTGPFRNLLVGERHIHHFVPGILLAFLAGGASVISRNEDLDPLLALPFGAGVALTLDESALLLELDDVYWTEEGIVSVQITLAALGLLSAAALATRILRRGERRVLAEPAPGAGDVPRPLPPAAERPASR